VLYIGISIAQNITVKTKHIAFKCNFSNKKERRLHLFSSRSFDPSDNERGDDKKSNTLLLKLSNNDIINNTFF